MRATFFFSAVREKKRLIGPGRIVGIHYANAKASIEGLPRAYASRLGKESMIVNAIAPSSIATDMIKDIKERRKKIPLGRSGRPEKGADAVVFLAGN